MISILKNALKILNGTERKQLGVLILLNLLISIIDIASLALLVMLIAVYAGSNVQSGIIQHFGSLIDKNSLVPISIFVFFFMLKSLIGYLVFVRQYRYVYQVASVISEFNLLKYLQGNYSDFVLVDSSVRIRKILHQPIEFCHYVLNGILQIATESILSLLTIIVVLLFNAKLFLLLSLVLLPPVVLISYFTKRILKNARANVKVSSERSQQYLQESLSGYIESNIYDKNDFFVNRFARYQQQMTRFLANLQTSQGISSRFIEVFAVLGLFIIILSNKFSGNGTTIEIIDIGAFMAAAYKIIPGIVKITNIFGQIKTYEYTIDDLLHEATSQNEKRNFSEEKLESIVFQDVSFSHNNKEILNNCNFEIYRNSFIGVSGASGRGKTTIINLVLGFLSPDKGNILINDKTTSAERRQSFWRQITYVQQRPFLVHDTIRTNITLDEKADNDLRLDEIIDIVGLRGFVDQSPEGICKIITENGKNISGGQRQRVAIARALYKDANVIILDEPFSELDHQSEKHILEYLQQLSHKGKMIILITHKRENLLYCDKTYTID